MRARDFVTESADEEAWELVLQPVPEIQAFVAQMDLGSDEKSVAKIASAIQATPDTALPAANIARLKNLANKPGDPDILRAIQKISGQPDAAQQYTTIMARRDAGEGRDRGYDVSNLVPAVRSGNYEPPVLLRLPSGVYVIGGRTRLYAALALDMPIRVKIIGPQTFAKQGVTEGKIINTYLWHGSRQKIPVLEPRQSVDTGGAAGSNQNAIYATSDPKVAIAMGLTTPGSDTGMFPNDPQMVLFSGKIRKGENVYLHRVPFNGPDGKPQFVQGGNSREFHSIPSVKEIKPIEIKEVPVNRYLNLIRKATREDWALRKKFMRKQGVQEVKILSKVKGKGSEPGQLPRFGRPIGPGEETRYLGTKVADWQGREIWRDHLGGQVSYHLFDPDTRTVIVTTFGSRYKNNPRSYIIHGLYAAPGNPVRAAEFYRGLVRDLGLTLISDRKQSPGGNRVWQQLEQFPDVEVYGYDTNTDQALNFGAKDVEMYTVPSAAVAGSREMQQVARDLRLVATARSH